MQAVKVPTLGIVGSLDTVPLGDLQELKRLRPDMKLVVLEGVSHTGRPVCRRSRHSWRKFAPLSQRRVDSGVVDEKNAGHAREGARPAP